jgi:ABC-type sugar transport system ATPase subunit
LLLRQHVSHNVALPHLQKLSYAGIFQNKSTQKRLAERMGQEVSLKARGVFQKVRELSGGNQQKIVFARAMAMSPRVLLLDEPTRGVDVGAKTDIYNLIRQASHGGTGILLASSDLAELLGLCDRVVILQQGRQMLLIENSNLTPSDLLTLCYQGIKS